MFCLLEAVQLWVAHLAFLNCKMQIIVCHEPNTGSCPSHLHEWMKWGRESLICVSTSSCALGTVRPNKLKPREFGAEKDLLQGNARRWAAHAFKNPELPEGFQQSIFKSQVLEWCCRVCNQLVHNSLIGWWWGNRAVSQGFTWSVLGLQEAWGYVLTVIKQLTSSVWWGVFTSAKQLRKCASNTVTRSFREELKQRVRGGLSREDPIGSCSVTYVFDTSSRL